MTNEWTTDGRPMSRIAQRFWGGVGQRILDSGALDGTQYKPGQTADEAARLSEYDRRWAYYLNDDVYGRLYRAGLVAAAMPVSFNPIPAVASFYTGTALAGDVQAQPVDDATDADGLTEAVALLHQWSNWEQLRRDLTLTAAVLGDVFLKVAERQPSPEEGPTAVYMQDIPPQNVRWWDADERGFLTGIRIDTARLESIFTGEKRRHTLIEIWRKEWPDGGGGVRYWEIGAGQMFDDEKAVAPREAVDFAALGYDFIPIVWLRVDTPWRRQVAHIDRYNALAWQAARLNRPLAVIGAGGVDSAGRPLAAPLGASDKLQAMYSDEGDGVLGVLQLPGMSSMQWSSSPVDFAALGGMMAEVKQAAIDGLPEYQAGTGYGLAQLAAETLQLLMNQAEQRALTLRSVLERTLVRAQMMAISIAQLAEVRPDIFGAAVIGTYEDGRIEHVFNERPVFTRTSLAKAAEAAQHVANGASIEAAYRLAGYSEAEAMMIARSDVVDGIEQ